MKHMVKEHLSSQCALCFVPFRDLCNASVSVPGDCFSVAVVQQLSRKDLDKIDEQSKEDTEDNVGLSQRI